MSTVVKNRVCKVCGHDKFTRDVQASAGDISCVNCGAVAEENPIVSEVQFGESSSGAAMVQGAMVGADQARANFNMRNAMESREQTLLNAKKKIKKIASVMRIADHIVDSATGWFKLALVQNFVQGRRSQNVIAACLYVACRHERTPHLLIDFSSRLQISVYSLGSTYLKLVRALQIQKLPIADPSLFIQHFADRLLFGDKTARVVRDATKLAERMCLDWIYEGRRPAGIAGACVLLAARMNRINRSHAEIVAVARVGEETIQKRLNEFKSTSSGQLKLSQFRESTPTKDQLPPSFKKNRIIEKKVHQILLKRQQELERLKGLAERKLLVKELNIKLGAEGREPTPEPADETTTNDQTNQSGETSTESENSNEAAKSSETTDPENASDSLEASKDVAESTAEVEETNNEANDEAEAEAVSEVDENSSKEIEQKDVPSEEESIKETETAPEAENEQPAEETATEAISENVPETEAEVETIETTPTEELAEDGNPEDSELFVAEDEEEEEIEEIEEKDDEDDENFGYEELPDDPHDETFRCRATKILRATKEMKERKFRLSTLSQDRSKETESLRFDIFEKISEPTVRGRRSGNAATEEGEAAPRVRKGRKYKTRAEQEKERVLRETQLKRDNSLLKAVLDGGSFDELELEEVLNKFLELNSQEISNHQRIIEAKEMPLNKGDDVLKAEIEKNTPRNLVANNAKSADLLAKVRDDDPDEEDDTPELNEVCLLEEEVREKERIWIAINYDFLIAQEKKRLKMEADELTGNTSGQPKKRRKVKEQQVDSVINDSAVADAIKQIGEDGRAMTPADSAKQIFTKKAFSRKINYGSITELFNS